MPPGAKKLMRTLQIMISKLFRIKHVVKVTVKVCPSKCQRKNYSKIKKCAQASAKGGIILKFEFRQLIFDLSKVKIYKGHCA